jgi:hypothetical protein
MFEVFRQATQSHAQPPSQLFVTISKSLTRKVKREFESYCATHCTLMSLDEPVPTRLKTLADLKKASHPTFWSFRKMVEFMDSLTPDPCFYQDSNEKHHEVIAHAFSKSHTHSKYSWDNLITGSVFQKVYYKHAHQSLQDRYSSNFVMTEIFLHIKGSFQSVKAEKGYLSLEEYLLLEQGRSNEAIIESDRHLIYKFFLKYRNMQETRHEFDVVDATHWLLKKFGVQSCVFPMKHVYVDEVQDLLPCQLVLISKFFSLGTKVMFCGDLAQCIALGNHFRFATINSLMYELYAPVEHTEHDKKKRKKLHYFTLTHNYRCQKAIVDLANHVIKALKLFFPKEMDLFPEEKGFNTVLGKPGFLRLKDRIEFERFLFGNSVKAGADQVILVKDQVAKMELESWLMQDSERVIMIMTIEDAKGLEFNNVILYNFFMDSSIDWRVLLNACTACDMSLPRFSLEKHYSLCQELKLLYVGVTRTRERLYFFEEDAEKSVCFQMFAQSFIDMSSLGRLRFANGSVESDWGKYAWTLFERNQFREAEYAFAQSGEARYAKLAKAKYAEQLASEMPERYREAAALYVELDDLWDAARCCELGAFWEEAAKIWGSAKQYEKQLACLIKLKAWVAVFELIELRKSDITVNMTHICSHIVKTFYSQRDLEKTFRAFTLLPKKSLRKLFNELQGKSVSFVEKFGLFLVQNDVGHVAMDLYLDYGMYVEAIKLSERFGNKKETRDILERYVWSRYNVQEKRFMLSKQQDQWVYEKSRQYGSRKFEELSTGHFFSKRDLLSHETYVYRLVFHSPGSTSDYKVYRLFTFVVGDLTRITKETCNETQLQSNAVLKQLFGFHGFEVGYEQVRVSGWMCGDQKWKVLGKNGYMSLVRKYLYQNWQPKVSAWLCIASSVLKQIQVVYVGCGQVIFCNSVIGIPRISEILHFMRDNYKQCVDVLRLLSNVDPSLECTLVKEFSAFHSRLDHLIRQVVHVYGRQTKICDKNIKLTAMYSSSESILLKYLKEDFGSVERKYEQGNATELVYFKVASERLQVPLSRAQRAITKIGVILKTLKYKRVHVDDAIWIWLYEDALVEAVFAQSDAVTLPVTAQYQLLQRQELFGKYYGSSSSSGQEDVDRLRKKAVLLSKIMLHYYSHQSSVKVLGKKPTLQVMHLARVVLTALCFLPPNSAAKHSVRVAVMRLSRRLRWRGIVGCLANIDFMKMRIAQELGDSLMTSVTLASRHDLARRLRAHQTVHRVKGCGWSTRK